jgi:hypothetical protein
MEAHNADNQAGAAIGFPDLPLFVQVRPPTQSLQEHTCLSLENLNNDKTLEPGLYVALSLWECSGNIWFVVHIPL